MKLFLTSSCISENLRDPFLNFLDRPVQDTKLFFIPTASDVEENKFYTCKSMDDLAAVGLNPVWYALKHKTREQLKRELSQADVIWVNGGNTFHLLEVARKTGFLDVVRDLVVEHGVCYGGTSAGSILASPTIVAATWGGDAADPNMSNLQDFSALHLVPFLTHVHYDPGLERDELDVRRNEEGVPIYAIQDGGAVEVNGDVVTVHGPVEEL